MPDFIGAARRKWAEMTEAADDYKHAKCYANTPGGCSTKISGEHYVSHGLIKLYGGNDPDFTVQHKTGKGVGHPVQPKNFKANILCQTHNSALSPADDAALKIASFLRRIALKYDAGAGEWGAAEEVTISGDDMQRWVLKLFLNHAVTGHFDVQQNHDVSFPPEAIDLLLDRAAWPSTWGLTVPGDPSNKDVSSTDAQGKPVAVTGTYIEPDVPWPGKGPRPLLAYATGPYGAGEQCAPSRLFNQGIHFSQGFDLTINVEEAGSRRCWPAGTRSW